MFVSVPISGFLTTVMLPELPCGKIRISGAGVISFLVIANESSGVWFVSISVSTTP